MKELTVTAAESGRRLDKYLDKYLADAGRSFIYKMLRKKNITLNDKKATGSEMLSPGDIIKLYFSDETLTKFSAGGVEKSPDIKPVKLDIIYEDDDVLFINKPAGMLSQKASADDISLCEHIISYLLESGQASGESLRAYTPGVCNRLDRNTSGLITAGKTVGGLQELSETFKSRTADKFYLAIVNGVIRENTAFTGYLKKDEKTNTVKVSDTYTTGADTVKTEIMPLSSANGHTLVKLKLITGKTHQLRATLGFLGYPIAGDRKYGNGKGIPAKRPMLHSYELIYKGKTYRAQLPGDFRFIADKLGLDYGNLR